MYSRKGVFYADGTKVSEMIETSRNYHRGKDFIFKGTSSFYKTCTLIVQYTIKERQTFLKQAKTFIFDKQQENTFCSRGRNRIFLFLRSLSLLCISKSIVRKLIFIYGTKLKRFYRSQIKGTYKGRIHETEMDFYKICLSCKSAHGFRIIEYG